MCDPPGALPCCLVLTSVMQRGGIQQNYEIKIENAKTLFYRLSKTTLVCDTAVTRSPASPDVGFLRSFQSQGTLGSSDKHSFGL